MIFGILHDTRVKELLGFRGNGDQLANRFDSCAVVPEHLKRGLGPGGRRPITCAIPKLSLFGKIKIRL
jgi:hypothetical protein